MKANSGQGAWVPGISLHFEDVVTASACHALCCYHAQVAIIATVGLQGKLDSAMPLLLAEYAKLCFLLR